MAFLSVKYLALLWGISLSLSEESVSVPETSSTDSAAAEPSETTRQPIAAFVLSSATQPPSHSPAATAEATVSSPVEAEEVKGDGFKGSTEVSDVLNSIARASTDAPAATMFACEVQSSTDKTILETAEATRHQRPRSTSTDTAAPAAPPGSEDWVESVSVPKGAVTLSSSTFSYDPSPFSVQNHSSFSPTAMTTKPPSAVDLQSSSSPVRRRDTVSTSLPALDSLITTSRLPDTAQPSSTAADSSSSSTHSTSASAATFTSPTAASIAHVHTRSPAVSSTPGGITEAQPCSKLGVVKHCLIVITALAGVATIFMVSTIILCTKLSTRKHKTKTAPQGTEMMCISSLLPEKNYNYRRQRSPVANGVLVIHRAGDNDEDASDNVTLSSFLPENDHSV